MDRGRKRKTTGGTSPEAENGSAKRQKTTVQQHETAETTTRVGLQLVEQLKSAKDKTGRLIADLFIELPNKRELPDYYQAIKLPISIQTIQNKLERHEYPNLTAVEGDAKRMVANAKQYNDDKSIVFQDAERIRKLLSNFMTKHNPAYKDPDYVAVPTPVPGQDESSLPSTREHSEQPRKITLSLKASRARKSSVAATAAAAAAAAAAPAPAPAAAAAAAAPAPAPAAPSPAAAATDSASATDFKGKTFQQAQEQIVNSLVRHTDKDDWEIFQPFVNLPPRSLTDYYKFIKKPMSLAAIRKRVRGQHGREAPTGVSDFKSWDSFAHEVSYIWRNAKEYNEDGSDMFNLAGEFEQAFNQRLALARHQVDEPAQPKIKLSAPRPKPVLHLGARSSPAPRSTPATPAARDEGVAVKAQETPVPQKSSSAAPSRSNSQVPAPSAASAAPVLPTPDTAASTPPAPPAPPATAAAAAAVKTEKPIAASPAPSAARLQSLAPESGAKQSPKPTTSMPPPAVRGPSGSPHPSTLPQYNPVPAYIPPPPTFVDQYARTKPIAEALLPGLVITTNPQLNLSKPFRIDIPASSKFTHQSLTITLPSAHYYLSIIPTVSPRLLSGRQYKLFVTVNGVRLMATARDYMNGDIYGARKQSYDAALVSGVNRIEVEIVAVAGRSGALETEKLNVFANLLRA